MISYPIDCLSDAVRSTSVIFESQINPVLRKQHTNDCDFKVKKEARTQFSVTESIRRQATSLLNSRVHWNGGLQEKKKN